MFSDSDYLRRAIARGDLEGSRLALRYVEAACQKLDEIDATNQRAYDAEGENHRLKREIELVRQELSNLDVALAVVDHKALQSDDGNGFVGFYALPPGPWHRVIALRKNLMALVGMLRQGNPTVPCPMCGTWTPVPMEDVPEADDAAGRGRVGMRCIEGHEWRLAVYVLAEDMRGEQALDLLPLALRGRRRVRLGDGAWRAREDLVIPQTQRWLRGHRSLSAPSTRSASAPLR
jgi:hypothetical protein